MKIFERVLTAAIVVMLIVMVVREQMLQSRVSQLDAGLSTVVDVALTKAKMLEETRSELALLLRHLDLEVCTVPAQPEKKEICTPVKVTLVTGYYFDGTNIWYGTNNVTDIILSTGLGRGEE